MAFWERVKEYFNLQPDKEDEQQTIAQISSSVAFRGANLWVLIFAILIASLGLNVNSTAVIIGAMLISPLMGPIIGMGLAVGINDLDLLRRSAKHFGVATLISVLTAMCYFLISPLGDAQSELLARTSPTLYDVLIAFCGGAAGIIALTTRGKGNVIPGVAIATALMPPLCTAGYGLATGHWLYFLGAFYLFFINTVFICLATFLGVRLLKFHQLEFVSPARAHKARNIITAIVLATMIPAAIMTINIVEKSIFGRDIKHFVDNELTQDGTQILSSTPDRASHTLNIVAVGREISPAKSDTAQSRMKFYDLEHYRLNIIQGTQTDSLLKLGRLNSTIRDKNHQLQVQMAQIAALQQQLGRYTHYETMSTEVSQEVKALYPAVLSIGLSPMTIASTDTLAPQSVVVALVQTGNAGRLNANDRYKLQQWLRVRTQSDSLMMIEH